MRALTAAGHYDETADGVDWLEHEAADVVAAIETHANHAGQVVAVVAVLTDTSLHDTAAVVDTACLRRDAEDIVVAVTTGVALEPAGRRGRPKGPAGGAMTRSVNGAAGRDGTGRARDGCDGADERGHDAGGARVGP